MSIRNLNEISFCDTTAANIEEDLINVYEALADKKLYPGDPVRIFLEAIATIITQQRVIIDFTGKQNLLSYAEGDYLDHVVALVGVTRLDANVALCTVQFTLSSPQSSVITIPKGTRLRAGELYFHTLADVYIQPGELEIDVVVECMTVGVSGNGLLPGQINQIVDVFPYFSSVVNLTKTEGGTDRESDDALRERAFQAPSSYSCAGSDGAYAFWAKTVSPEIGDIAVISPSAGEVQIIPIGIDGKMLSDEILNQILAKCSEKHVKPLTDKVSVIRPVTHDYTINIEYWVDKEDSIMAGSIQEKVIKAIDEYKIWQKSSLGRDINPSELIYRIMQAGAKRVNVISPVFAVLDEVKVANLIEEKIIYGGIDNG